MTTQEAIEQIKKHMCNHCDFCGDCGNEECALKIALNVMEEKINTEDDLK